MTLSQAIRYASYPAAVCCLQTCFPYSRVQKRILAHVVKQGGRLCFVDGGLWQIPPWYIVGIDHISLYDKLYYARHYPDDVTSYGSLDRCYQWLKQHEINPQMGWYPAGNPQQWIDLGAHQ